MRKFENTDRHLSDSNGTGFSSPTNHGGQHRAPPTPFLKIPGSALETNGHFECELHLFSQNRLK